MSRIMGYTELEAWIKSRLPEKRYIHSLAVAKTASTLASLFSQDRNASLISGLYHDAYRYITKEDALREVEKYSIDIFPEERENGNLLHAPIAAYHMRDDIGPVPSSYVDAVRYHTLGSKDMGPLGAIIYIADYTEPNRKHIDDDERMRIFSLPSLEAMVCHIIEEQNVYFKKNGIRNARVTDELYEYLKEGGTF